MDEGVETSDLGITLPWPGGGHQPAGNGVVGGRDTTMLDVPALLVEQAPITEQRKPASDAAPPSGQRQTDTRNHFICDDAVPMLPPERRR